MEQQQMKQEHPGSEPSAEVATKPSRTPDPAVSGPLASFEAWLYDIMVVKAPFQIPKAAKDWIVRYGPWITLVAGILLVLFVIPGIMAALALAGYSAAYGSMYGAYGVAVGSVVGPMFYIALVVLAVQLIIMFVSVPMLLKRQRNGWLLVFYSSVVSLLYTVFNTFSYGYFSFGSLIGGLIGAVVSMYVIFQIRSYYKS